MSVGSGPVGAHAIQLLHCGAYRPRVSGLVPMLAMAALMCRVA